MDPDLQWDGVPPPQMRVIDGLQLTSRQLSKRLDREVGILGLTWAQARVLLALRDEGSMMHAGEVGRAIGVTRQAAHQVLARLDEREYLRWDDDGFTRAAGLTLAGRGASESAEAAASGTFDAVWRVAPAELHALVGGLVALRRELARAEPDAGWWMD